MDSLWSKTMARKKADLKVAFQQPLLEVPGETAKTKLARLRLQFQTIATSIANSQRETAHALRDLQRVNLEMEEILRNMD